MLTIIGRWEKDWLDPKVELFMWRQLKAAFRIDRLVMVPRLLEPRTSVDQYEDMQEALDYAVGQRVFLEPSGSIGLPTFTHPEDTVYVFGKAGLNNIRFAGAGDDVVSILTPGPADMFAVNAASIVLAHRMIT